MKILLLGSGGREHALAWKMLQSPLCTKLFVAPGNAGTAQIATNVKINVTDFEAIRSFVISENIEMLVVGPEDPLVLGIYDYFQNHEELKNVMVIGPSQLGAKLEGSKEFAKQFLERHNIPTAKYQSFTAESTQKGCDFIDTLSSPFVLKADGLAAGKGVLIINDREEAKDELRNMLLHAKFGAASAKVVVEEFLDGIELSCFVITDGKNYKILPTAKDYKRIGEGDTGLNTGGMGAISPVPFATPDLLGKIEKQIAIPTISGLSLDGIVYKGFVFIGLIIVKNEPFVIEYNVRMGDPETEVVMPRIDSDVVEMFLATANGTLNDYDLKISNQSAATVMVVSGGYPEVYEKGKEISGIENIEGSIAFHAGTKTENGNIVTNGGRVIAVTSMAENFGEAIKKSYQNIAKLNFDRMYFRKDIGFDLFKE